MEGEEIYIIRGPRNAPPGSTRPVTGISYRRFLRNLIRQPTPPTQTAANRCRNPQPPPVPATGDRSRESVLEILKLFRERSAEIFRTGKTKEERRRVDMKAFTELKRRLTIPSTDYVGAAPGVEVGDVFEVRAELILTGVHGRLQNGIDFVTLRGRSLATCVISKIGHKDRMEDPDSLVYRGEGGMTTREKKLVCSDQVMRNGNLALKNSMEARTDVRVLRGVQDPRRKPGNVVYVYDGLYRVVDCKKKCDAGNMVFDFHMKRKEGQKRINWKIYR